MVVSGTKRKQTKAQIKRSGQGGLPGGGDHEPKQETARQQAQETAMSKEGTAPPAEGIASAKAGKLNGAQSTEGNAWHRADAQSRAAIGIVAYNLKLLAPTVFWETGDCAESRDSWVSLANLNSFQVTLAPWPFLPFRRGGN